MELFRCWVFLCLVVKVVFLGVIFGQAGIRFFFIVFDFCWELGSI